MHRVLRSNLSPSLGSLRFSLSRFSTCCNTSGTTDIVHPLEPLSQQEVTKAVSILKQSNLLSPSTRVISIYLKEPPKQSVYNWKASKADLNIDREAYVSLHDNSTNLAQAVYLNLNENEVIATKPAPKGAQPTISVDEMEEAEAAVLTDPSFKALVKKHYGIDDISLVMVDIWSVGKEVLSQSHSFIVHTYMRTHSLSLTFTCHHTTLPTF